MSLYQIQKLMYEVNRNPEQREEYRKDKAAFAARYDLIAEERDAIARLDIRRLYQLGVHPSCFARLPCFIKFRIRITPKPWRDWSKLCRSSLLVALRDQIFVSGLLRKDQNERKVQST